MKQMFHALFHVNHDLIFMLNPESLAGMKNIKKSIMRKVKYVVRINAGRFYCCFPEI
jgi:hypothetical protein